MALEPTVLAIKSYPGSRIRIEIEIASPKDVRVAGERGNVVQDGLGSTSRSSSLLEPWLALR